VFYPRGGFAELCKYGDWTVFVREIESMIEVYGLRAKLSALEAAL